MKRILLLGFLKSDEQATGGRIVDTRYIKIMESNNKDIEFIRKDYSEIGLNKKVYSKRMLKSIVSELNEYDALICDERGFANFIFSISYIKRHSRINIVAILHHFYFLQFEGMKQQIIKQLELRTISKMEHILFTGIYPHEFAQNSSFFKNVNLHYTGIGFDKEEIVKRSKSSNANILFIGHIIPRKGPNFLVSALIEFKKRHGYCPKTRIIGNDQLDCNYTEKLKILISKAGLTKDVIITGRVSDTEKEQIVSDSGIFVFPSLCEGFGMVVLETMKYGIPSIVFNNTNLPYIVKDGYNGYVLENGDVTGICNRIEQLLDPDTYSKISENAEDSYRKIMTWDEVRYNLDSWIEKL